MESHHANMKAKARIRFMKECEYWCYSKRFKQMALCDNGKRKYRYIEKRTCRDRRYKLIERNLLINRR